MVTRESRQPAAKTPSSRGINFAEFQERTNHVDVKYKDANSGKMYTVGVTYWPARLNDESIRSVISARSVRDIQRGYVSSDNGDEDTPDYIEILNVRLIYLIKEWDIFDYDDDGNPTRQYSPEDIVRDLEVNFKTAIMEAITKDTSPGEARKPR